MQGCYAIKGRREKGTGDTNKSVASSSVVEKGSMVGARQRPLYTNNGGLALARPAGVGVRG